MFNLLRNSTTIEGWEKDKVATMVRKGQILEVRLPLDMLLGTSLICLQVKFPYDLGTKRNIKAVLGNNPLLWCLPHPMLGNGLRFDIAEHAGKWENVSQRDREYERV
jgi:palmitoyltransferase